MIFTIAEIKFQSVAMSDLCFAMASSGAAMSCLSKEMKAQTAAMKD